jgi:WD40 repeat protein
LAAATDRGISLFQNLERGKPQKLDVYPYADMGFAEGDQILFVPEHGALNHVDLATGTVKKMRLATHDRMARIAMTRDSHQFVLGQPSGERHPGYLSRRSSSAPTESLWQQPFHRAWIKGLFVLEDRDEILVVVQNERVFPTEFWFETTSLSTGAEGRRSDLLAGDFEDAALSPDGRCLAVFNATRVYVYPTLASFTRLSCTLKNEGRKSFTGIAFHPTGLFLAATSNDTTVKLYDTATWQLAKTFTWDVGRLRSVAFSPDGALAAVGSDTGKVVVWDVDL